MKKTDTSGSLVQNQGAPDSLAQALAYLSLDSSNTNAKSSSALKHQYANAKATVLKQKQVASFIEQRKMILKRSLAGNGFNAELLKFEKSAYYFKEQTQAFADEQLNPKLLKRKVIDAALQRIGFKEFLDKLFPKGSDDATLANSTIQGLQGRAALSQSIANRFGSSVASRSLISQSANTGRQSLEALKYELPSLTLPKKGQKGKRQFRPNHQRTKSFRQRLTYEMNFQSQRARFHFPATSDLGFAVGYRLHDKSSISLGVSGKVGLGTGFDNISFSGEGLGLRSVFEYQLKEALFINGGFEMNFRSRFQDPNHLTNRTLWQQSGLIGLSRKMRIGKRSGSLQVFWDFLSYQQVPQAQAFVFRTTYRFK
ncbi:MAG: hypothetical protein EOP04_14105 [Proteobacteria bacterium]|nr:MAG: hypothetical protein EOP04_14105 [Pseudomonadota bacterium]